MSVCIPSVVYYAFHVSLCSYTRWLCIVTTDYICFFCVRDYDAIWNYVTQFVDVSLSPCCDGIFADRAEGVQKESQPQPIPSAIDSG